MSGSTNLGLSERIGTREVFGLAWPIIVSMLSFTLNFVIDSLYVARLGTAALGAVGLASAASFGVLSFPIGLLRGAKIVVAQSTGAADEVTVHRTLWHILWMVAGLGLVTASFAALAGPLFAFLGGSEEVQSLGSSYFVVRALGSGATFASIGIKAWFEGRGDTKTPMRASILANASNIVLDPFLIYGWAGLPALGLQGAAIATVIANLVSVLYLVGPVRKSLDPTVPRTISRQLMTRALSLGAPVGLRQILEVGAWVLFMGLLSRVSEVHLAAHTTVARILSVSFLPAFAISEAGGILVGQSLGAGRPALARQSFRASCRLAMLFTAIMAVLFVGAPNLLLFPFGLSPEVEELCRTLLVIGALFQFIDSVTVTSQGALNGAGDTRFVLLTGVGVAWCIELPLAWWVTVVLGRGAPTAWWVLALTITTVGCISLLRIRGNTWIERGLQSAREGAVPEAS